MKQYFTALVILLSLSGCMWANGRSEDLRLFDIAKGREITLAQAAHHLKKQRIIIVGEHHNQKSHHMAQLLIIQTLHDRGIPLSIGLEMFRAESQNVLDEWVSGKISESDFKKVYYDNWSLPWPLYSMIFHYSQEKGIPLVGLNVPRTITWKVAQQGFQSLSKAERGNLSNVACTVDRDYMDFIRKAYGAHAHGQLNFTYFCEAQLVWDTVMAINALDCLEANPRSLMILLTGAGHAWKKGIPEQIRKRSALPYMVILPNDPGNIEPGGVSEKDADYIVLGL